MQNSVAFIYRKIANTKRRGKRRSSGARSSKPIWLVPREEGIELLRNATPATKEILQ